MALINPDMQRNAPVAPTQPSSDPLGDLINRSSQGFDPNAPMSREQFDQFNARYGNEPATDALYQQYTNSWQPYDPNKPVYATASGGQGGDWFSVNAPSGSGSYNNSGISAGLPSGGTPVNGGFIPGAASFYDDNRSYNNSGISAGLPGTMTPGASGDWNPNSIPTHDFNWQRYATPEYGGTAGAPASGGWNPSSVDAFGQAWMASGGRTVDDLKAFVAAHPEYGATLTGSKGDKVTFPNGRAFDAVIAAGDGGRGASWGDITGGGGGSSAGGGSIAGLGSMGLANGSLLTPWTQQFAAPTAEQALQSPGLQFALDEANRLGQGSAAARGTLLNGRTQQALYASNIQNALQGYGDVYSRALGEYGLQRENFYNNQDRPFGKLSNLASLGANAANQTGGYGSIYGNQASGSLGSIGNANSAGSTAQGNIWGSTINNLGNLAGDFFKK